MLSWLIFKNYLMSRRSGALVRVISRHCIFGIGMGVAALVIVLSIMNGFNRTIRQRMLGVEPHLVLQMEKPPTETQRIKLSKTLPASADVEVESIVRFETQDLIIRSIDGVFGGAVAKGYDAEALHSLLTRIWRNTNQETSAPLPESSDLKTNEVIMGVDLARSMGIFEGDEVVLVPPEALLLPKGEAPKFQKFKVKSLISTQVTEVDSKILFYNIAAMRGLKSKSLDTGLEVRLANPGLADRAKKSLVNGPWKVQTWGERDTSLFFALKMESMAMSLFLILAVLITSFSIVIVMVLLMSQKRRDIGMLMALGMSVGRLRVMFLQVGLMLSFSGIFGGMIVGATVALLLGWYPLELLPDIYTDTTLPADLTPRILGFVFLSSSLIAIAGSSLPVWRYILSNPADSLRKKMG